MATLESRIEVLEKNSAKGAREVFRIVCAGATPTPEEQAQIDEANQRGAFVICRLIVEHECKP